MSDIKERPILFQGAMVRALLNGTKTQTRRVMKPQPRRVDGGVPFGDGPAWAHAEPCTAMIRCPYGQRGDRLWVRETSAQNWNQLSDTRMDRSYVYRADGEQRAQDNGTDLPWRPSIHMPRVASRITLEITGVRVERLQDISEADAVAEGVIDLPLAVMPPGSLWAAHATAGPKLHAKTAAGAYRLLWESINGPDSWDANPWVWVVEFIRIEVAQ